MSRSPEAGSTKPKTSRVITCKAQPESVQFYNDNTIGFWLLVGQAKPIIIKQNLITEKKRKQQESLPMQN